MDEEYLTDYMGGFEYGITEALANPIEFLDTFSGREKYKDFIGKKIKIKNTAADMFVQRRRKIENAEAFEKGHTAGAYTAYIIGGASLFLLNLWARGEKKTNRRRNKKKRIYSIKELYGIFTDNIDAKLYC